MEEKFEEKLGVVHDDHENFVDARRNVNDVLLQVSLFFWTQDYNEYDDVLKSRGFRLSPFPLDIMQH